MTVTNPVAKRFNFIDHYRGIAVIVMIEVHAVNAWLSDTVRQEYWYGFLKVVNGMVAPSFLFISGVSFLVVAEKRFKSLSTFGPEWRRQLRRYLWIGVIGYLLHLPSFRMNGWIPSVKQSTLAEFYKVDILQTIAVSLIVLLLLCLMVRKLSGVVKGALLLSLLALFASPFLWNIDFSRFVHPAIECYLNGLHNPLFPLFPWAVFLWSGAVAGGFFLEAAKKGNERSAMNRILISGLLFYVGGYFWGFSHLIPYHGFWQDSPQWVLMRLGIVLLLFWLFWRLETIGFAGSTPVTLLGRESLFAYIIHLLMIYSITGDRAKLSLIDTRSLALPRTLFYYLILLSSVVLTTWIWKRIMAAKRRGSVSVVR